MIESAPLRRGDVVRANMPGSWIHNKFFLVVDEEPIVASDGVDGILLQGVDARTVVNRDSLILLAKVV